jgi:DHA2 family multidrug resistance protein
LAPVVGPTLGGYLTVNYNWRWIFYINIPVGALGLLVSYLVVKDPEYLINQRAELRRQPLNFDYLGLGLLALAISAWEIMLSKGQEWDWYNDPTWRVQTLFIILVGAFVLLVRRELRIAHPVIDFRPLAERNFAASSVIIFCAFAVLYGASTSLPGLLQSLFGYDAYASGLVQSPSGIFSILMLVVVGTLLGRGTDARWLIAAGLIVMAIGNYWMALMNLYVSPGQLIWPRVVLICGLSLIFAPISVAAFKYTPTHLRAAAVGLFALLRNEGGSVGTSVAQTLVQRREQFHNSRIGDFLDPFNPAVQDFSARGRDFFLQQTGDANASQQMTVEFLESLRQQQSVSLAYFDTFWLFAALAVTLIPLVFLMKPSAAEKGTHIGAE